MSIEIRPAAFNTERNIQLTSSCAATLFGIWMRTPLLIRATEASICPARQVKCRRVLPSYKITCQTSQSSYFSCNQLTKRAKEMYQQIYVILILTSPFRHREKLSRLRTHNQFFIYGFLVNSLHKCDGNENAIIRHILNEVNQRNALLKHMTSWRTWTSLQKCAHGQNIYSDSVSCILITKFTHSAPCRVIRFKFLQKVRDDGLVAPLCGVMQWCHFILKRADIDGKFQPFKLKTSYWCNTALMLSKLPACIPEAQFPPVTQLQAQAIYTQAQLFVGQRGLLYQYLPMTTALLNLSILPVSIGASLVKTRLNSYLHFQFCLFLFLPVFAGFHRKQVCGAKSIRILL